MAHLQYSSYKGVGERILKTYGYSQAVRVGDRIECAGQGQSQLASTLISRADDWIGGWHPETGKFDTGIDAQIQQAFANVDLCIRDAGGKGWSQVYRVNSYHVPVNDEVLAIMSR
jgi:enamine deaminase RidA (YjgF/YER057c/UK114 family)